MLAALCSWSPGALGSGLVWNSRALRNPGRWAVAAYGCDTDASTQTLNLQRRSKGGWCSWMWAEQVATGGRAQSPWLGCPKLNGLMGSEESQDTLEQTKPRFWKRFTRFDEHGLCLPSFWREASGRAQIVLTLPVIVDISGGTGGRVEEGWRARPAWCTPLRGWPVHPAPSSRSPSADSPRERPCLHSPQRGPRGQIT